MAAKRAKLTGGKDVLAFRIKKFRAELLRNGGNATQAAISVGYSKRSARTAAARLMARDNTRAAVQTTRARLLEVADLTAERTLLEIGRLALFDPADLYRADGSMIPIHELPEDTRRAIASVEHDEILVGGGKNRPRTVVGTTKKLRFWDKGTALDKLAKANKIYDDDNRANKPDLSIQVLVVSPEDLKRLKDEPS